MGTQTKKIIWLAGGDGLVGRRLAEMIDYDKFTLVVLSRKKKTNQSELYTFVHWDTRNKTIDNAPAPNIIINLAGAGIADSRWTSQRKKELVDSRVSSAKTIEKYLRDNNCKPELYISASAVGYYGDKGKRQLTEKDQAGDEFMSSCCEAWENAAHEVSAFCDRTVILRIGIVLSMKGGALPKMMMTRLIGVFNYFGDGNQYYPWIHIDDLCNIILTSINETKYEGIFNAVAPQEITQKEMMKNIISHNGFFGILLPAPAIILKLILGEMSKVVLNSNRVIPTRLMEKDFRFQWTDVGMAVKDILSRKL